MRILRARHALVAMLLLALAGCQSGGSLGSLNPFKSASSAPQNPYPVRPAQQYASSATSNPSSSIGAGSASTPAGAMASRSTSPSGSMPAGTASRPGGTSYPATAASYNSTTPGATPSYPSTGYSYPSTAGSGGYPKSAGTANASDASMAPQRGAYDPAGARPGAAMTPGTGSYPAGASGGRSYPSSGMPPSGGSYATGGAGGSSYPATRSGSGADATPFRSPSGVMPRGDSMSDRAGDDRFSPPSDRSPVGGPAYTSPFDATSPARSGTGASYYNAPSSSASPATGGYDPNVRTARADATRASGGTNPFGGQGAAGSDFRPNSAAGDFRSGAPASDYRPGATGYNPPASDYRPGETGYNPPTTDYRSGTSGASPSGASQYPYRMPTSSTNSPATGADDGAPYLPGSSKQFSPRTTVAGAPSGGFGGTASAARTDSSVSPAGYNQTNPNMGRL